MPRLPALVLAVTGVLGLAPSAQAQSGAAAARPLALFFLWPRR